MALAEVVLVKAPAVMEALVLAAQAPVQELEEEQLAE